MLKHLLCIPWNVFGEVLCSSIKVQHLVLVPICNHYAMACLSPYEAMQHTVICSQEEHQMFHSNCCRGHASTATPQTDFLWHSWAIAKGTTQGLGGYWAAVVITTSQHGSAEGKTAVHGGEYQIHAPCNSRQAKHSSVECFTNMCNGRMPFFANSHCQHGPLIKLAW